MAYLDTSALVACYCPEKLSAAAEAAVRGSGPPTLSPLAGVELRSALALKIRTREIPEADARRILTAFDAHCAAGVYRFVPVGDREYALAGRWIETFTTTLRALDALHLAAAHANNLTIVTVDRNQARAARALGVACLHVGCGAGG